MLNNPVDGCQRNMEAEAVVEPRLKISPTWPMEVSTIPGFLERTLGILRIIQRDTPVILFKNATSISDVRGLMHFVYSRNPIKGAVVAVCKNECPG